MKLAVLIFFAIISFLKAVEVGEVLPSVVLKGELGSKVDGSPFRSEDLKGKTWLVIYSDPDKRGLNDDLFEKIKSEHFPRDRYGSVAIINMAATWMPNFAIDAALRAKQRKYPDTIYVRDLKKYLVDRWKMVDDDMNILIIDSNQKVLFKAHGALDKRQKEQVLQILQKEIGGGRTF